MDLTLQADADYKVDASYEIDTRDHEDHTYNGIMFTVKCQSVLPLAFIEISEVWVRGELGPMTVWTTPGTFEQKHEQQDQWNKAYDRIHRPSPDTLVPLVLPEPVRLKRGESLGIYVHSGLPNDKGLVYDNQKNPITHQDRFVRVGAGLAHKSRIPFSAQAAWGAWRPRREFVGRLKVGAKYQLWQPECNKIYPHSFREMVRQLLLCQKRPETTALGWIPTEVVYYIANMCAYDWAGGLDTSKGDTDVDEEEAKVAEEPEHTQSRSISLRELLGLLRYMPPAQLQALIDNNQLPPQIVALIAMHGEGGAGDGNIDLDEILDDSDSEEEEEYAEEQDEDDQDDAEAEHKEESSLQEEKSSETESSGGGGGNERMHGHSNDYDDADANGGVGGGLGDGAGSGAHTGSSEQGSWSWRPW